MKYFILIGFACFFSIFFVPQLNGQNISVDSLLIDSLVNVLNNTESDQEKLSTYIEITEKYDIRGYNYKNGGIALEYSKKAIELARQINDQEAICQLLIIQCSIYQRRGKHDLSYQKNIEALELAIEIKNTYYQHRAYNYLGILHGTLGEMPKALENFEKALEIARVDNIQNNIANYLSNISMVYTRTNQPDKALTFQLEAAEILKTQPYRDDEAHNLINIGENYQQQNKHQKAIEYYLKSLALENYVIDLQNEVRVYSGLNECYQALKQYNQAIRYGKKSIEIGKELNDPKWLSESYKALSLAYEKANNYPEALKNHQKYKVISDQVFNEKQTNKFKELDAKYQTAQKEEQLVIQKLELSQKTNQRNIFILAAIIALGLGWYFWRQAQLLQMNKRTIEQQADELQQLYDSKNRFFANIAHELRTPLTLIAGPVEAISKREDIPVVAQKSLNIVNRNVTYLKQLVNQILDLSKKEVNGLSLQVSVFNFSDLLKALIDDFQSFADFQKIVFQTPNNIEKAIELTTDGEKLFIILKNLLSNAFKYTHSGGAVMLNYVELEDALQISIQDTGKGIIEKDLVHIFKPYFQTSNENAAIEGGTGIGLAICKEYIEQLNGSIQVNSEVGKGSIFMIQFPKQLTHLEPSNVIELSFSQKNSVQETINPPLKAVDNAPSLLVVEDNLDICQHLEILLQEDYQITFANNGAEGLIELEKNTPDLILTDLMMPVMNGFELVEKVKAQDKWRQIPIITLTARSEMTDKLQALRIGVDDYLIKPFLAEELKLRIEHLLKNSESRQVFQEEIIEKTAATTPIIDNNSTIKKPAPFSMEDEEWLKSLEAIVNKEVSNVNFNVTQLCLEMAVSSSQLYQKLKKFTGLTPKQYIDQIRYAKARKMLEMRVYGSIKRISYEVGFKDEKHFSRNFKKRFGIYPSTYLQ